MYVFQLYRSMFPLKNGLNSIKISYTGSYISFPIHYGLWGGFLKRIVTNLPPTKFNEINIFHSDVQKHTSYTGSHKRFVIYYGLCLETAGNVF